MCHCPLMGFEACIPVYFQSIENTGVAFVEGASGRNE